MDTITFKLNGASCTFTGDPETTLLTVLRNQEGIMSVKDGCAPQAACGCCAVEMNGKIMLSCAVPMRRLADGAVRTLEGLDAKVTGTLADAFAVCGAAQCGFCIPGIVARAAHLLHSNPDPTDAEIRKSLNQHLCRCTGYTKIVEAIDRAGEALRTGTPIAHEPESGRVGSRMVKHDARRVVLGQRPFVADMNLERQLHGALRLSDHPRAIVTSINVSKAKSLPGVERIFLAKDVPGQRSVGLIVPDWPLMIAEGEITRYIGDCIACVAATTREAARKAAAAIEIEYEVLDPVCDVFEAMKPDAPQVHASGNVLSVSKTKKGDVDTALAQCAHVVEHEYTTQRIEHAFMEPEACIATPTEHGVKLWSQSQGVYEDRRQVALLLGLAEKHVEVELVPNGGGFGGKEDLSVQGHTALMAHLLQRPVKVELTRDESIRVHPKRHPLHMAYTIGADAQGKLLAVRAKITGDTGAYASVGAKVLERAAGHSTGAYHVPNVDVVATAVYTNNVPCGAMRGFGANQATFALECAIDELCALAGFDRWQFRYDNALTEDGSTATGQVLATGIGIRKTLEAVKDDFQNAKYAGIACGLKNTGIGNGMPDAGTARIIVRSPNHVEIHHGWTEMGQGVHTMAIQTFCEETGLPPDICTVHVDTRYEAPCGMTTASRATSLVGNAVIEACKPLKAAMNGGGLAQVVGREFFGEWICDWTNKPGKEHGQPICTHYSYSYATQVVILNEEGKIERIIAAHDAGRVMNPTLFEGQIEGSLHMGLGYALTEDLPQENGHLLSTRLKKCGVLRAQQTPPMEIRGVEEPDEFGPYGAKGVGEIGLVPTAPAVANALAMFDGVRRRSLPMTDAVAQASIDYR
ncbi:MAG: selenium-dependent xanthine dehydrogenase [Phycisphaerales bacterium]|nr:selenium-dependent xanthine dehydrogenase [Phycisphaerales bacterium]